MIPSHEIVKRLLIWFIVAVAIVPRQHVDRRRCSIGGHISYPFKQLLLGTAAVNFVRLFLKDSSIRRVPSFQFIADALGILQQFMNSFLCFLTPYLLQTWLRPYVNLPGGGRPGANLMMPLYISTALSTLSVILVRMYHPNWWCLRKLGYAVSSPPVLSTLQVFDSVTTRGGHHDGRGNVLSQSLKVVEYWFMAMQLLCAIGFALNPHDSKSSSYASSSQIDQLMGAFRDIGFLSEWIRILGHALFINQLDELYLSTPGPSEAPGSAASSSNDPKSPGGTRMATAMSTASSSFEDVELADSQEMISLVARKPTFS